MDIIAKRKEWDKQLDALMEEYNMYRQHFGVVRLIKEQEDAEFVYRKTSLVMDIYKRGFEMFYDDIIWGMNQGFSNITSDIEHFEDSQSCVNMIRSNNESLMRYELDYIDRWKMYAELLCTSHEHYSKC